jgi:hypothetical protein
MADDDDRKTVTRRKRTVTREAPGPMRTSTVTTAPENPAGVEAEPDDSAFFSSGHGPALHYDRRERSDQQDEKEAETSGS